MLVLMYRSANMSRSFRNYCYKTAGMKETRGSKFDNTNNNANEVIDISVNSAFTLLIIDRHVWFNMVLSGLNIDIIIQNCYFLLNFLYSSMQAKMHLKNRIVAVVWGWQNKDFRNAEKIAAFKHE
jgi:hypothetical protein